ncbi:polyprenyl synthetase [Sesbania bispinosa]|nr:polyprenyl synthetase [Sesbania bispinosa]
MCEGVSTLEALTEELASLENVDELAMAMGQIETRPEMTNLETDPPKKRTISTTLESYFPPFSVMVEVVADSMGYGSTAPGSYTRPYFMMGSKTQYGRKQIKLLIANRTRTVVVPESSSSKWTLAVQVRAVHSQNWGRGVRSLTRTHLGKSFACRSWFMVELHAPELVSGGASHAGTGLQWRFTCLKGSFALELK